MESLQPSQSPLENFESGAVKTRPRRPCDSCRKRKSRCEFGDNESACTLCLFHRRDCTFIEEPQPRKRKSAPTVDEGERRKSQHVSGPQDDTSTTSARTMATSPPVIRQDVPVKDYAQLKGPSLLKKTLGLQSKRHSRLIGGTSEIERQLLEIQQQSIGAHIPVGSESICRVSHKDAFLVLSDDRTPNYEHELEDLDAIETIVAPHGQALLHLYFRIVHPSFPILHKNVFLEKYQRTHREFSPALLAAVYILALNWWSYSSDLGHLPKPDTSRLEVVARRTMNYVVNRPKLSTIQAGLLLLQRPDGASWALTTQLVGVGQELGLHLDCSKWHIPSWERGLRKRLAWALFMQDKWGALIHGRPSHIFQTDWAVWPVTESDFPENAADEDEEEGSTEVEKGRTLFLEMIRLTEILSEILSTFYTARAMQLLEGDNGVRMTLERAKPLQLRLKEWYAALPETLKLEHVKMRKLSSTGYLYLAYYTAEITLHRIIIQAASGEEDASLVSICRTAALARLDSAMEFVKSLKGEHLQSFWYFPSMYGFAMIGAFIGLLWKTSSTRVEAQSFQDKLDEYRWVLRLSSRSADILESALNTIVTTTDTLVKAARDPFTAGRSSWTLPATLQETSPRTVRIEEEGECTMTAEDVNMPLSPDSAMDWFNNINFDAGHEAQEVNSFFDGQVEAFEDLQAVFDPASTFQP